jgi:arsenate reductase
MIKVLVLCVHNSARSQIGEEYIRKLGGDRFEAESAGLEPGALNPYVVRALAEDGIDISGKQTRDVFDFYKKGKRFHYVITVCSKEAAEKCPIFPGVHEKLYLPFPDPSTFQGTDDEIMAKVREVRDQIKEAMRAFVEEHRNDPF